MNATTDAAAFLLNARRSRAPGERIPEACRPGDAAAAIAIQRRVTELLGIPIGGWKCSVPTAQRPVIMAPIYATTIAAGSPCPIMPIGGMARVEPEVAFVIGRDLPPRDQPYTEAEIRAAIREPRLVLELIGTRYADPTAASFPELLADGIANQGLYVGPAVPGALDQPLAVLPIGGMARVEPEVAFVLGRDLPPRDQPYTEAEIRSAIREPRLVLELIGPRYADPTAASFPELLADGIANQGLYVGPAVPGALDKTLDVIPISIDAAGQDPHAVAGKHPDGHPLLPLLWLANYLAQHDTGLHAGQIVTTGSYCGVVDVPLDTPLTVRFGELGTLSVRFVAG